MHWKLNVPVVVNVRVNAPDDGDRSPELTPSAKVTLCVDAFEAHVHVTVVPDDTTMFAGLKLLSATVTALVATGVLPALLLVGDVESLPPPHAAMMSATGMISSLLEKTRMSLLRLLAF